MGLIEFILAVFIAANGAISVIAFWMVISRR